MKLWIEWKGGDCPVGPDVEVEVKLRGGSNSTSKASGYAWKKWGTDDDIIAYRVLDDQPSYKDQLIADLDSRTEPQGHPHAAIMAEYAEVAKTNPRPWEEFEVCHDGEWFELGRFGWFSESDKYRRKPAQPKKRKIKFKAYLTDSGTLMRILEGVERALWTRLPALDIETEIEE